ncbi:hypothetical protein D3C71_78900 [compost metagenome]
MTTQPEMILLELKPELRKFRSIIFEMDMPTIDQEAAMSRVFEALTTNMFLGGEDEPQPALAWVANDLSMSDGLAENWEIDDDGRSRVYSGVVELGDAVRKQLIHYGAYSQGGTFPYEFKGFLDHDTVILRPIPHDPFAGADAADPQY